MSIFVAHQGAGDDSQLRYTTSRDGQNWAGDQQVPDTTMIAALLRRSMRRERCSTSSIRASRMASSRGSATARAPAPADTGESSW